MTASLEDLVRHDIERWLGGLDERLSEIESMSEDDRKRAIKTAVRHQRKHGTFEFEFKVFNQHGTPIPFPDSYSDRLLEVAFKHILSAEYVRKARKIVSEKLAGGDLPGAYQQRRDFLHNTRFMDFLLKRPVVRRGEVVAAGAKRGHEAAHGTDAEKSARSQGMYDNVLAEEAKGTKRAAAVAAVAERYGVKDRTVYRAIERHRKNRKID